MSQVAWLPVRLPGEVVAADLAGQEGFPVFPHLVEFLFPLLETSTPLTLEVVRRSYHKQSGVYGCGCVRLHGQRRGAPHPSSSCRGS